MYDQAMKDKDSSSGNGDVISNTACRNMSHNLAYMYVYIYIYIERERERDISIYLPTYLASYLSIESYLSNM